MIAPGHPARAGRFRLPAGVFDVMTLPGARGAALWRWWLDDACERARPVALEARCALPYAPPCDPPSRDAEPGVTVIRLDLADDRPAGIVIHL